MDFYDDCGANDVPASSLMGLQLALCVEKLHGPFIVGGNESKNLRSTTFLVLNIDTKNPPTSFSQPLEKGVKKRGDSKVLIHRSHKRTYVRC